MRAVRASLKPTFAHALAYEKAVRKNARRTAFYEVGKVMAEYIRDRMNYRSPLINLFPLQVELADDVKIQCLDLVAEPFDGTQSEKST